MAPFGKIRKVQMGPLLEKIRKVQIGPLLEKIRKVQIGPLFGKIRKVQIGPLLEKIRKVYTVDRAPFGKDKESLQQIGTLLEKIRKVYSRQGPFWKRKGICTVERAPFGKDKESVRQIGTLLEKIRKVQCRRHWVQIHDQCSRSVNNFSQVRIRGSIYLNYGSGFGSKRPINIGSGSYVAIIEAIEKNMLSNSQ